VIALASPDELRRSATNGDLLDVQTAKAFDVSALGQTDGVRQVSQLGPRHFRVVVDDAGSALPVVVGHVQATGVEVESAREHRLSFDEIFAVLVSRHREAAGEEAQPDLGEGDDDWPDEGGMRHERDEHDGSRGNRPEAAA